ncbi:endonuclease domain-containing protein [Sphingomonas lenta]|uniref:DUF559 domain-containing protein n=1 Tax=Sphingomonas lenta TaxID=1141887 RepID=A0A2A2SCT6_9SPHN|nr:hypothetical protein CKY28_13590 [Sphingomonas lenta]
MPKIDEHLLTFAKEVRREMTPAEARLWYHLRAKRLNGVKFVRQSVRRPYIADFVARSHKLIIEIDGDTHAHSEGYDAHRTAQLERDGYRVVRFTNSDVMSNEEGVISTLLQALGTAPLPSAALTRGSLPLLRGERDDKSNSLSPLGRGPGRGAVPE